MTFTSLAYLLCVSTRQVFRKGTRLTLNSVHQVHIRTGEAPGFVQRLRKGGGGEGLAKHGGGELKIRQLGDRVQEGWHLQFVNLWEAEVAPCPRRIRTCILNFGLFVFGTIFKRFETYRDDQLQCVWSWSFRCSYMVWIYAMLLPAQKVSHHHCFLFNINFAKSFSANSHNLFSCLNPKFELDYLWSFCPGCAEKFEEVGEGCWWWEEVWTMNRGTTALVHDNGGSGELPADSDYNWNHRLLKRDRKQKIKGVCYSN